MDNRADSRLTPASRRQGLCLGHVQGALWATGTSLTTGTLISYLAIDLGAKGLDLSLILAVPSLAGLLRLAAPRLIRWIGSDKAACLTLSIASYGVLALIPFVLLSHGVQLSREQTLAAVIGLSCVHQLLEYTGLVAFWSWIADLAPLRVRGRYLGRRQAWQIALGIAALLASGYFVDHWRKYFGGASSIHIYTIPIAVGVACLFASLVPLALMPGVKRRQSSSASQGLGDFLRPLADRTFRRLLLFRAWFSFSNGLTQTVQALYPKQVLKLSLGEANALKVTTMGGQLAISPVVGKFSDKHGNRPVLELCQVIVALSLLFFLVASPVSEWRKWLIVGSSIAWWAYAGHNVCLYNLMLKLAPGDARAPYVAMHEALGSACHATATVAGGWLFDRLVQWSAEWADRGISIDPYAVLFCCGIAMRLAAMPLVARIDEPGARRWRDILRLGQPAVPSASPPATIPS